MAAGNFFNIERVKKIFCFLSLLACAPAMLRAQNDSIPLITVSGKVLDADHAAASFPLLMVVNLKTGRGFFGSTDGKFSVRVQKSDTLLISAIGYQTFKLCFADSVQMESYHVFIKIKKLMFDLKPVEIFPERELDQIESDLQSLGYDEKNYRLTGIDAWSSPLTAMYQEFSKRERDKRRAALIWNESRKNELLRELLAVYNRSELISLPPERFDDFIDYLRLNDEMLRGWTQYELAFYVKTRYERFISKKK